MNIAELFVRVRGDTSDLTRRMSSAEKSIERFGKTAGKWLGLGLGAGFAVMVKESIEAQNALAQLEARIKSTGGAAGRSIDQLTAQASALQKITTYSDDAVQGAQALLLTFKQIKGDEFDRATKATLDLATALNTDLKSAALQLGKALEDPVRGMTALRRSGVSFTKEQEEVIKKLVQTGKVAEAQNLILAEMETQFGGAAEAARNTLGGALLGLKNAFTDTLEVSRDSSAGIVDAINAITAKMSELPKQTDRIRDGFNVVREQFSMFKYDMVVTAGIVAAALSLIHEAAGRAAQALSFGKFGGDWVAQAKALRDRVRAYVREAQHDMEVAGIFRGPGPEQTSGQQTGEGRDLRSPEQRALDASRTPPVAPKTEEELKALAAAAKAAKDALWQSIDAQFKAAFDWFEESLRSSSSAMTRAVQAVQNLSDSLNLAAAKAGLRFDFGADFAKVASAPFGDGGFLTGPPRTGDKPGFVDGKWVETAEMQAKIDQVRVQNAEQAAKAQEALGGRQLSKLDEVKAAIFDSGALMHAAMMALGDKILLGGSGAGSRTGGGIGGTLGGAIGTVLGGPIGAAIGGLVGTALGSAVGGTFDKSTRAVDAFSDSVRKATASIGNIPDWVRVNSYRYAAAAPGIGTGPMDTRPSNPLNVYGNVYVSASSVEELNREIRRNRTAGGLGLVRT